ncbi:hypothetical protein HUO12_03155 [Altererythrobacter sp. JGD-16]|uniref:Uncharacterized protein n=2 Tax=Altererythrobacter lutimaris TaxID=2743979 RepID=A0A850H8N7_9SPHN|nr:hypothetical protein [Altererythrobacter lutimaris]
MVSFLLAAAAGITLALFLVMETYRVLWVWQAAELLSVLMSFGLCSFIIEKFWSEFVNELESHLRDGDELKGYVWARWLPFTAYCVLFSGLLGFANVLLSDSRLMTLLGPILGVHLATAVALLSLTREPFVKELRK